MGIRGFQSGRALGRGRCHVSPSARARTRWPTAPSTCRPESPPFVAQGKLLIILPQEQREFVYSAAPTSVKRATSRP